MELLQVLVEREKSDPLCGYFRKQSAQDEAAVLIGPHAVFCKTRQNGRGLNSFTASCSFSAKRSLDTAVN